MRLAKKIIVTTALVAFFMLSGCTTPYTNKELLDIFNAKGLDTLARDNSIVVFLPGVFFDVGKADLTQLAQFKLGEIASVVNDPRVTERVLLLEGHTDSTGSDEDNSDLSHRRATSVYQSLIAGKVNAKRMSVRGFGEKYPIADNTKPDGSPNPEGQAKNRRVEIVVKNP